MKAQACTINSECPSPLAAAAQPSACLNWPMRTDSLPLESSGSTRTHSKIHNCFGTNNVCVCACSCTHKSTLYAFKQTYKNLTVHTQQSQIFILFSESGFVPPHDHLSSLFLSTQQFIQQGVASETSAAIVKV